MSFLTLFTVVIFLVTIISLLNERFLKMPNDIALLAFSFSICVLLKLIGFILPSDGLEHALSGLSDFSFEAYLLDGVLCFMLFAGASKVHFNKFTSNIKSITLLSFLTTAISAALYGALFYLASYVFGWGMDIWLCILLGCIVSPTDPIAATGIMNKLGLSKNVTTVIESESLFNDGMGVALFAFVKSIVTNMGRENFALLMVREVLGAAAVAFAVSCVLLFLMKRSHKPFNHILISILAVSSAYVICELCGFSGVIASVICGMAFSYGMDKMERFRQVVDKEDLYSRFWDVIDSLLNSVLFVLIGLTSLRLSPSASMLQIGVAAIIAVLISRGVGVALPTAVSRTKRIPGGYNLAEYTALMTWSALKGGLSLALVLSTQSSLPPETYMLLLHATYIIILFTVIVQGMTTKKIYRVIERHKAKRIRKESELHCVS
ncbi:MAG: sodium:proton antiporter [Clostridiales bacterium]|nr:sodium:proton antiporter [Clostridiales bacterium]